MKYVLGLDPGYEQSALVVYNMQTQLPERWVLCDNERLLVGLRRQSNAVSGLPPGGLVPDGILVVEWIESMGLRVGREVFETCYWSGRFVEAHQGVHARVSRRSVKLTLTGRSNTKDADVRQALIDRYGMNRRTAIGTKRDPGPLYGVRRDLWSALAVAVTWADAWRPREPAPRSDPQHA